MWMISVVIRIIKGIIKGTLHGDCERGDIEGVKRHLADGADVNAKDNSGDTPLHIAAFLNVTRKSPNYSSPKVQM